MTVTSRRRTYQASDLAGASRRQFLDDAKEGIARLRDTDGSAVIATTEETLERLTRIRNASLAYLALQGATERPRRERRPSDFGELAWVQPLDDADLALLRSEMHDELVRVITGESVGRLDELLHAWRLTVELIADDAAMADLNRDSPADLVDVPPPDAER